MWNFIPFGFSHSVPLLVLFSFSKKWEHEWVLGRGGHLKNYNVNIYTIEYKQIHSITVTLKFHVWRETFFRGDNV
jgi:hypothetical protein